MSLTLPLLQSTTTLTLTPTLRDAHLAGLDNKLELGVDVLRRLGGLGLLDGSHFVGFGGWLKDEGSFWPQKRSERQRAHSKHGERRRRKFLGVWTCSVGLPAVWHPSARLIPSFHSIRHPFVISTAGQAGNNKVAKVSDVNSNQPTPHTPRTMASALVIGLGTLGAGFAGLTALRMLRGAKGAEKFVRGGFKMKMDRSEAIQILGLR